MSQITCLYLPQAENTITNIFQLVKNIKNYVASFGQKERIWQKIDMWLLSRRGESTVTKCPDASSHADPSWLASSRGRGSTVGRGRGLVDGLSLGGGVLSVSVVDLIAHLLGQGELDGLTGGVGQAGDALLEGLGDNLDLRDGDALLLGGPRKRSWAERWAC